MTQRDPLFDQIASAIRGLRFGSVEIQVHDGEIVQVERREKVRVARQPPIRPTDRTTGSGSTKGEQSR